MDNQDLPGLTPEEIAAALPDEKPYRAQQIFAWVHRRFARDFDSMSDLPAALRAHLPKVFDLRRAKVADEHRGRKGVAKYGLELFDGARIEMVDMPSGEGHTLCVSTQVGCREACAVCATGGMGFVRNLTAGEIIDQILLGAANDPGHKPNVVFMGMGEPLSNYVNLMRAVRIANDGRGLSIGARRMTVSTCGLPAGIRSLAGEKLQLGLAVSLNAADDETRMRVMPRARPIRAVLAACRYYQEKTKRRITFEYVLCQEVNSGAGHARRLSNLLRGFDCLVNVIPFNPHPLVSIPASASPTADQIGGFRDLLEKLGLHVTVRFRKGRDIRAACGQLAAGGLRKPGALPPPPPRGRGRPLRGNR